MERVEGIEPSCAAWKAAVLPLNYTRTDEKMDGHSPKKSSHVIKHYHIGSESGIGCKPHGNRGLKPRKRYKKTKVFLNKAKIALINLLCKAFGDNFYIDEEIVPAQNCCRTWF